MSAQETAAGREARAFVAEMEARLAPLMRESNLASWDAAVGGGEEALERATRARSAVAMVFADAEAARKVRGWLEGGVADPLLRRQLVLLNHDFTRSQLPPETIEDLVRRGAELEHIFHTFRATF
ncbi:MAG: hypothetical protein JO306_02075, partial [Gemmatimonadetes bacterium]|nr:hypothetical protein [Gemmatimonadota bacterium]